MTLDGLPAIAAASQRYGSDPLHVFGGGGNTSFKTAQHLFIKPSGVSLATIQPEQFVKMDRTIIRKVFAMARPEEPAAREAMVKSAMAAAVCPDSSGRPSVEAPVHELLPMPYVVHMHSILVNGMTCAERGAEVCARLFPDALWVEFTDPGYALAMTLRDRLEAYEEKHGKAPNVIILQSHGVFVGGETIAEIDGHYERLTSTLQAEYDKAGLTVAFAESDPDLECVREWAPSLRTLLGNGTNRMVVQAAGYFAPAAGPLSPDHIVYGKSYALLGNPTPAAIKSFTEEHGYAPVVISVPGKATFTVGANLKTARVVMAAARNAELVARLTMAFGGTRWLTDRERSFIENWEVESYRKQVAQGSGPVKRMQGKIMVVTGGAQGFGLGIADRMAAEGATVILADLNLDGARAAAADLDAKFGAGTATAVGVNIADEASVQAMTDRVLQECGGLDVLIANAGVLRAGSVKTLEKRDWDLVTNVNYTGYFLCVKHLSPVMAAQNVEGNSGWMDIIQISSKSGLQGSNRNAAYAGSKFGGIGLTQSFAMELISDRIKVNSICPGNFFDGPLWSDPEKGLFVQYLNSGKVPGAKTIADVRKFYEAKVPMGRGCEPEDVALAILYAIEQQYETGQAIPVTGGQVMLK